RHRRTIPLHLHNRPIHMRSKPRRDRWDRAINMPYGVRPIILTTHNGGNIPVPVFEREITTILNRREISLSTTPRLNFPVQPSQLCSKLLNCPIRLSHVFPSYFLLRQRESVIITIPLLRHDTTPHVHFLNP